MAVVNDIMELLSDGLLLALESKHAQKGSIAHRCYAAGVDAINRICSEISTSRSSASFSRKKRSAFLRLVMSWTTPINCCGLPSALLINDTFTLVQICIRRAAHNASRQ